jgi:hypothetical protein
MLTSNRSADPTDPEAGEAEAGGAPHWATVMTDPNWPGDDSPVHGWERHEVAAWNANAQEPPALWREDDDMMTFLKLEKESPHPDEHDHEQVLSFLGIARPEKVGRLAGLDLDDADEGESHPGCPAGAPTTPTATPEWASAANTDPSQGTSDGGRRPVALNVAASPFVPGWAKAGGGSGSEDGTKLNPAAVPFVPGGVRLGPGPAAPTPEVPTVTFKPTEVDNELGRAQAAVRRYQSICTALKEELQVRQRERDAHRRTLEDLEQSVKETAALRAELRVESARAQQANDQLAALQADMAYYRKLMAQVQAQLQTMWPQLMEQLQQERAARLGAQEAAAHTQAALQVSRLEGEQNALRIAELEAGLREAQLLAQQHQERAEASQKEAQFYRTMYTTATKQAETSNAAVKASLDLEKQTRQETGAHRPEPSVPEAKPKAGKHRS